MQAVALGVLGFPPSTREKHGLANGVAAFRRPPTVRLRAFQSEVVADPASESLRRRREETKEVSKVILLGAFLHQVYSIYTNLQPRIGSDVIYFDSVRDQST